MIPDHLANWGFPEKPEWGCWVVYHFDMGVHVDAIFPEEIDALRYAVDQGFTQKVKRVTAGDITDQLSYE